MLEKGCRWAVANGYGVKEDLENTEENGCMEGGDASKVSDLAKQRGLSQLGTLGAGNHFLEVEAVSDIYDIKTAKKWGIINKDRFASYCIAEAGAWDTRLQLIICRFTKKLLKNTT